MQSAVGVVKGKLHIVPKAACGVVQLVVCLLWERPAA